MATLSPAIEAFLDDHPPRPPEHDSSDSAAVWRARARDAEERARKARQRAVEAEQVTDARERRIDALLRAMDSRAPIEQAKGVLMTAFGLDAEGAFDALVWVSQNANVKLTTVVERFLVDLEGVELGERALEDLTFLLAAMGRPGGQHFT